MENENPIEEFRESIIYALKAVDDLLVRVMDEKDKSIVVPKIRRRIAVVRNFEFEKVVRNIVRPMVKDKVRVGINEAKKELVEEIAEQVLKIMEENMAEAMENEEVEDNEE